MVTKRRKKPTKTPEEREQVAVAKYLDRLGLVWKHTPNGGYRGRITGAKMKAQGVKAGVFDIEILTPSPLPGHAHYRGLAIELKAPHATAHMRDNETRWRSSAVSDAQREWRDKYIACGWMVALCYGFDEVVEVVRDWGFG